MELNSVRANCSKRASAEDSRETCGYTAVVPKAHPVSGAMCRPETRTTVPPPAKPDAGRTEVASAGLRKWNTAASSPFAADRKPPAPTAKKPSPRNASNAPRPNAENLEDARANVSGEREPSNPSVSPPQVISPWRAISPGADRAPTTHGARSCFRSVAPKTARVRAPAPPDSAVLGTANSTGSAETYSYHTSSSVYPAPVRAPTATRAAPISRAGATHSSVDPPSAAASASRASSGPTLPMRHAAGSTPTKFSPATTITSPPRSGPPLGVAARTRGVARTLTVMPEALRSDWPAPAASSTVAAAPGASAGVSHRATALETNAAGAKTRAPSLVILNSHVAETASDSNRKSAPESVATAPPRA